MWETLLLCCCVLAVIAQGATCPRLLSRRLLTADEAVCAHRKHVFAIYSSFHVKALNHSRMEQLSDVHELTRQKASTTAVLENLDQLYAAAQASRVKYAAIHNYTALNSKGRWLPDSPLHPSWDKPRAVLHALQWLQHYVLAHDPCTTAWVWALDGDAVIMNLDKQLESLVQTYAKPNTNIIIGKDCVATNFGSALFRAGPWTEQFLQDLEAWATKYVDDKKRYSPHALWEQAAFNWMLDNRKDVGQHVTTIPQEQFNSFPKELHCGREYQQGDFVLHFAGLSKYQVLDTYINDITRTYLQTA